MSRGSHSRFTLTGGSGAGGCRFNLIKHPQVMAKLEKELDAAGLLVTPERPEPRSFTFADIQLPYLQAVVKVVKRSPLPILHARPPHPRGSNTPIRSLLLTA